jgi:2-hydroxy-3-oxopropionate reductase
MNVGFVGLGIMGTPMAANLVAAGYALQVFDLKPVPASLKGKGVSGCASGREVAERSDVIIIMQTRPT